MGNKIISSPTDFIITFKYDEQLVDAVKQLPCSSWNPSHKQWSVPLEFEKSIKEFASAYSFTIDGKYQVPASTSGSRKIVQKNNELVKIFTPYSVEIIKEIKDIPGRLWDAREKVWVAPKSSSVLDIAIKYDFEMDKELTAELQKYADSYAELLEASTKQESDFDVPGLAMTLLPYQRAGVEYALKTKRTFIADAMGLGKTAQAIATIYANNEFPVLVLCPASLKENWRREILRWCPDRTAVVINSQDELTIADFIIINYDIVIRYVEQLKFAQLKGLICDESHFVKNSSTKRTKAVKTISRMIDQDGIILLLSGTPILNRPVELVPQLDIIGALGKLGGQWAFLRRYTNAKKTRFGWDFTGHSNLGELNLRMRQICYIRRTKDEVLKELPPKQRNTVYIETDPKNWKDYKHAEKDLIAYLRENGYKANESAEHLRRTNILKRLSGEAKLASVFEWIDSFLESTDRKLVVFAHHRSIVSALADRYGGLRISGDTELSARQDAVDTFQNDPSRRVIVLNIKAGGVGLTLTAASDVLFVEQSWTPGEHDQAEDRCHRYGQLNSVQIYYVLATDTIDEYIYELIQQKRIVVDAATEGNDAMEASVLSDLMRKFAQRGEDT
jgi:SWI/SNF-related matrix-associated actin-dependent regulator 1 of chromatin subfamily A